MKLTTASRSPSDEVKIPPTVTTGQPTRGSVVSDPENKRKVAAKPTAVTKESATSAMPAEEDIPPHKNVTNSNTGNKRDSNFNESLLSEEVSNLKANRELRGTYAEKAY